MHSLHSHQHHHHFCRGHMSVPPSCLEAAWPPLGSCFGQGCAICLWIHPWVVQIPSHLHCSLYCLSPPDGWPDQMCQPIVAAVPLPLCEWKARQLGWSSSHDWVQPCPFVHVSDPIHAGHRLTSPHGLWATPEPFSHGISQWIQVANGRVTCWSNQPWWNPRRTWNATTTDVMCQHPSLHQETRYIWMLVIYRPLILQRS